MGDWVSFLYGGQWLVGQVLDQPSPGGSPHRLYRISLDPAEPNAYELAAAFDEGLGPEASLGPRTLQFKDEQLEPAPLPDKAAICTYLRYGGLLAMLDANLVPDRPLRQAWITFAHESWRLAHTFTADRGIVGGATVPFSAVRDNKVLDSKKQEVIEFLTSFGLSAADAEDVLHDVGTVP